MEKVFMTAYNADNITDESICSNGSEFVSDVPFFLIANKPLSGKVYFEFNVDYYYPIKAYHNIPIYAGVSKEPSFGILNADFILGSLFYPDGGDYDITAKHNKSTKNYHGHPNQIHTRIPGATDIIGVGVDIDNNLISYYVNGELFYQFYTITGDKDTNIFDMSSESNLYFCIWSNIHYRDITADNTFRSNDYDYESTKKIHGYVNLGKDGVLYLPDGYKTVYALANADDRRVSADIDSSIYIPVDSGIGKQRAELDSSVAIIEAVDSSHRYPYLISNNENVSITKKYNYQIEDNTGITNDSMINGANVFVNLPIPTERKVYMELSVKNGEIHDNYIGIPISIGIANSTGSILSKSFRVNLFHQYYHQYQTCEISNFIQNTYLIDNILTTAIPEQGQIIGIELNLAENEITIYINKVKFTTVYAQNLDFSDPQGFSYLFIHDEGIFESFVNGSINFGQSSFEMNMPDGCISFWQYWTGVNRKILFNDINVDLFVDTSHNELISSYIFGDLYIQPIVMDESDPKQMVASINSVMGTFNTVTDEEEHRFVGDITLPELNALIAADNNGYYPKTKADGLSLNYGDESIIKYYTVTLKQTEHQTIYIYYNGEYYPNADSDDDSIIKVAENSVITVSVVAENRGRAWNAGTPSITRATVIKNMTITATPATVRLYTVEIVQSDHQLITVTCNGVKHTTRFQTTIDTPFTAELAVTDKGWEVGVLNIESGTITGNALIFASSAKIIQYTVNFEQPKHQKIEILYNGIAYTSSFKVLYGSKLTINVVSVDYGYTMDDNFTRFYTITEDITLRVPSDIHEAIPEYCTLTIVGDYNGRVIVNDIDSSVTGNRSFTFQKGTEVNVKALIDTGYHIKEFVLLEEETEDE